MLVELDRLPDPTNEHADPTHFTASALVVGARGTVLHLHKRLGRWMQPGGHIDAGEAASAAARREAHEELGLEVRHPEEGPRLMHLDVYHRRTNPFHCGRHCPRVRVEQSGVTRFGSCGARRFLR